MSATHHTIRCLINGQPVCIDGDTAPTRSVLNYLRQDLHLVGSKEGCAEGDCGACTVVLGEIRDGALQMRAVNACIQFVPTLDGKALFTVEYLRKAVMTGKTETGRATGLHPVQQAMLDHHASQCGFCTPGFVMSLWSLYLEHQSAGSRPDRSQIRSALTGNLCRCTGYRPILQAAGNMLDYPEARFEREDIQAALRKLYRPDMLDYQSAEQHFMAPRTLAQLWKARAEYPLATLLAGCTDVGLWVNKLFRELGHIIYLGELVELRELSEDADAISIGAGVSLSDAFAKIALSYPEIKQQWERFASTPIRNAGTLGGNVANGSPIGDSMPWLIALGAEVVLCSPERQRRMPLEDFYLDYMKKDLHADEIVHSIVVPGPKTRPGMRQAFRTYKLSKRHDSDISAVCAAFQLDLEGDQIISARVAFGGLAATPCRALQTELALQGQTWCEATTRSAMQTLASDFSPLDDMRASAENRMLSAQNLLYRFYLETRPEQALKPAQLSVFA